MDVSILIFYNKDRGYLSQAISSAYGQIFSGTFEVVQQSADLSTSANLNEGIKKCKGKYIKLLCDDDKLTINSIQDLYDKAQEGYDVVCANSLIINNRGIVKDTYSSYIPRDVHILANDNTLHGGTMFYKKDLLYFDETLKFAEEFELHLRLANHGYKFGNVDTFVYQYRLHDNQKSMQGGFTDSKKYLARKRYIRDNIVLKYQGNYKKIIK